MATYLQKLGYIQWNSGVVGMRDAYSGLLKHPYKTCFF